MRASLHILLGDGPSQEIPLTEGTYSVGRGEEMAIRIDSQQVSRHHADIVVEGNVVRLIDRGSANGTLLNGAPVSASPLKHGDRIGVGEVLIEYRTSRSRAASVVQRKSGVRRTTGLSRSKRRKIAKSRPRSLLLTLVGISILELLGVAMVSGLSFRSLLKDRLETESLKRAQVLVRYLAEKNREDLRVGNEFLLDVVSVQKEKGVQEALIVNEKNRILAPISRLHQADNDPFVVEALTQTSDEKVLPSPKLPDGTYVLTHPIRTYNDKTGKFQTLGVAKIVFSPTKAVGLDAAADRLYYLLLVAAFSLAILLGWLLSRLLTLPILRLSERIHQWRAGQAMVDEHPPAFRDWSPLYDAVDRVMEENE